MSIEQEYRVAREGCVVYAADTRRLIAVTGEDRVTFLHGMLSNDVKKLRPGDGIYAALLTQQGKIVSDVRVYADTDRLLLDVPSLRAEAVPTALEKFIVADDVELNLAADEQPLLGLTGPSSTAALERAMGKARPARTPLAHQVCELAGARVRVIAVDAVDGAGYTICGSPAVAAALMHVLQGAQAEPIGVEALNILRVEAGVPCYGVDMDEEILLMETNLDRAVSFTKGCYLGQEVVERVSARGKVNKKLTGLHLAGAVVPDSGTVLHADTREVGWITSAVRSLGLGHVVALGYVHRDFLEPGSVLTASLGQSDVQATVTNLPFVTR
jgi:folate-binding protein YgfZ